MICAKCERDLPDELFVWDDGILKGIAKRCDDCRAHRHCPDCEAARGSKCERHRLEHRKPGLLPARYPIRHHAVERFQQRVRPDIRKMVDAAEEMITLMYEAEHVDSPPAWYREIIKPRWSRGYLVINDDMLFALSDYDKRGTMVSTVLLRSLAEGQAAARRLERYPKSLQKKPGPKPSDWLAAIETAGRRIVTANRRAGLKHRHDKRSRGA